MPNGRLSKCVIDCRKSTELYHNTSGNAASVSLFANTISTTANTEMTVVVGIASTTLSQKTTMVSASAGTFCSMTTPLYYTDCNYAGVSTDNYWKPTRPRLNKIAERLMKVSNKLREIAS